MKKMRIIFAVLGMSVLLFGCGEGKSDIGENEKQNSNGVENNSQNAEENPENSKENGSVITAEEAKEIMDGTEEYIILDVREQDEYDAGHIEGAVLLPYTELEVKAETELPDKDKMILIYCRSGRRSAIAANTLVELGYTNVRDFGGIIDWPYEVVTSY